MNKEQLNELLTGIAIVALGYALIQHFKGLKKPAANAPAFAKTDPLTPDHGFGYDPVNPGEFIKLSDLLKGTVADGIYGQTAGDAIPTTSDIFKSVTAEYYGQDYGNESVVKVQGAYW